MKHGRKFVVVVFRVWLSQWPTFKIFGDYIYIYIYLVGKERLNLWSFGWVDLVATRSIENPWGIFDEALRARKKAGDSSSLGGKGGVGSHRSDGAWRIFFPTLTRWLVDLKGTLRGRQISKTRCCNMTVVDFFIIKFIHLYNVRPIHIPFIANQIKKSSCPKTNHNSWCQHGDLFTRNWCHPSNPRWTSTALRSVGSPLPRCRCARNVARILPSCYRWVNIT